MQIRDQKHVDGKTADWCEYHQAANDMHRREMMMLTRNEERESTGRKVRSTNHSVFDHDTHGYHVSSTVCRLNIPK